MVAHALAISEYTSVTVSPVDKANLLNKPVYTKAVWAQACNKSVRLEFVLQVNSKYLLFAISAAKLSKATFLSAAIVDVWLNASVQ